MSGYRVDLDLLDVVTARLAAVVEALDAGLDEVDRNVDAVEQLWTGAAAQAHRDGHRAWAATAREMHRDLGGLQAAAATAHAAYSAAVQANLRMFGRI